VQFFQEASLIHNVLLVRVRCIKLFLSCLLLCCNFQRRLTLEWRQMKLAITLLLRGQQIFHLFFPHDSARNRVSLLDNLLKLLLFLTVRLDDGRKHVGGTLLFFLSEGNHFLSLVFGRIY